MVGPEDDSDDPAGDGQAGHVVELVWPDGRTETIRVGSDADLVVVDMDREVTLRDEDVVSKCGWTPYDGMTVQGVPEATYVRGEPVVKDREVVGEPGYGEFVAPDHDTTPWA
mgnify:CR=1 FL=1